MKRNLHSYKSQTASSEDFKNTMTVPYEFASFEVSVVKSAVLHVISSSDVVCTKQSMAEVIPPKLIWTGLLRILLLSQFVPLIVRSDPP